MSTRDMVAWINATNLIRRSIRWSGWAALGVLVGVYAQYGRDANPLWALLPPIAVVAFWLAFAGALYLLRRLTRGGAHRG